MNKKSTLRSVANDYLTHPRSKKGITLIALVVTIIVLIILASVTINFIIGERGILTKAKEGRENYQVAANEETVALKNLSTKIDNIINNIPDEKNDPDLEKIKNYFISKGSYIRWTTNNYAGRFDQIDGSYIYNLGSTAWNSETQRDSNFFVKYNEKVYRITILADQTHNWEFKSAELTDIDPRTLGYKNGSLITADGSFAPRYVQC